jgi:hypothetical protein
VSSTLIAVKFRECTAGISILVAASNYLQHKRQGATAIEEACGLGLHPRILCSIFGHGVQVDEVRLQYMTNADRDRSMKVKAVLLRLDKLHSACLDKTAVSHCQAGIQFCSTFSSLKVRVCQKVATPMVVDLPGSL